MSAAEQTREPAEPVRALDVAKRSPEIVDTGDREAWLELYTDDASVEDPVGAGAYVGRERLRGFWDVFIAPQRSICFKPRRDFVHDDHVMRYVEIETVTPASDEPFAIDALVEYRVDGPRISMLRAFWEPTRAVTWHARKGAGGVLALTRHGLKMTAGLGPAAGLGFARALVPSVRKPVAREAVGELAASISQRDRWIRFADHARVNVAGGGHAADDPDSAWTDVLESAPKMGVEDVIVAGTYVVGVLSGDGGSAAAILRMGGRRVERVDLIVGEVAP